MPPMPVLSPLRELKTSPRAILEPFRSKTRTSPLLSRFAAEGRIDVAKIRPLARLGYYDYASVDSVFTLPPPAGASLAAGLEGSREKSVQAAAPT
jgi:hypothetical protein